MSFVGHTRDTSAEAERSVAFVEDERGSGRPLNAYVTSFRSNENVPELFSGYLKPLNCKL
jgi:hypothetical protein